MTVYETQTTNTNMICKADILKTSNQIFLGNIKLVIVNI